MQEIRSGSIVSKFIGVGQKDTTLITFKGVLKLVMRLPGVNAREMRDKFANVLQRYFAGDPTLVAELANNNASDNAVNSVARESLKRKHGDEAALQEQSGSVGMIEQEERLVRHKMLEIQMKESEARIREMDAKTKETEARAVQIMTTVTKSLQAHYAGLCKNGDMDDRARLHFKDRFLNLSMESRMASVSSNEQKLLTNGQVAPDEAPIYHKPLTITTFASENNIRLTSSQAQKVGTLLAKKYRDKYGSNPPKHEQFVDGASRNVNSYTREHEDIMREAIQEVTGRNL